jgi:hypothetical protein
MVLCHVLELEVIIIMYYISVLDSILFFKKILPGSVALSCNPSYWGGRDWEDYILRPVQAKNLQDPISTNIKLGVVTQNCDPSCMEKEDDGPGINMKSLLKR